MRWNQHGKLITRFVTIFLLLVAPAYAQQSPAGSTEPPVDPAAVATAIRQNIEFLYSAQKPDGSWELQPLRDPAQPSHSIAGGQWGGMTALTTYALLASGESPQDPRIARAITWLKNADMIGTYALGMRAQIWRYLPKNQETFNYAKRDWLLFAQGIRQDPKQTGFGTYDYLTTDRSQRVDLSASQYGVLGAWGAAQAGVEVPLAYWMAVDTAWRRWQVVANTGGWAYTGTPNDAHPVNLPMTTAGVATLFITQDFTSAAQAIKCNGNYTNPNLEAGLKWLQDHIGDLLKSDAQKNQNPYYTLYGIERIGVASGLKYFGTVDWFQLGAKWLLARQNQQSKAWGDYGTSSFANNSFALLFLSRGSAPVAINKLQYELINLKPGVATNWVQRPRDIANVTAWMGNQIERPMNWQIVNLKVAASDLHDAPMLYIAGNQKLQFSPEDEAKLKQYVQQGGLIVGNPDCNDRIFSTSFRDLGRRLFDLDFRELPYDHLLYTIHFKRESMRKKPRWQSLGNGAREYMILLDGDYARSWQGQDHGAGESDFQMMLNLFQYAVDSGSMRAKGTAHIVLPRPGITPRQTIKVARGQYDGAWNPEPGGWQRLNAIMLNTASTALDVIPVKLASEPIPGDVKVLHLTGTGLMNLDEAARKTISSFVEGGGTLVIDAAGGNGEFVSSADQLLQSLWPEQYKQLDQPLKIDNPLFAAGGTAMKEFRYRGGVRSAAGLRLPSLRGIEINGRLAVLYSREDISVGLVGMAIAGVAGYDPATATDLMKNILIYANKSK
ncbi:MAG: DUF4159 domain-containing protein [Phycisphaerales bacterium]|nr:DUF4159 domain-containing protein [Phycisphaerales bacterium]